MQKEEKLSQNITVGLDKAEESLYNYYIDKQ